MNEEERHFYYAKNPNATVETMVDRLSKEDIVFLIPDLIRCINNPPAEPRSYECTRRNCSFAKYGKAVFLCELMLNPATLPAFAKRILETNSEAVKKVNRMRKQNRIKAAALMMRRLKKLEES